MNINHIVLAIKSRILLSCRSGFYISTISLYYSLSKDYTQHINTENFNKPLSRCKISIISLCLLLFLKYYEIKLLTVYSSSSTLILLNAFSIYSLVTNYIFFIFYFKIFFCFFVSLFLCFSGFLFLFFFFLFSFFFFLFSFSFFLFICLIFIENFNFL